MLRSAILAFAQKILCGAGGSIFQNAKNGGLFLVFLDILVSPCLVLRPSTNSFAGMKAFEAITFLFGPLMALFLCLRLVHFCLVGF